MLRVHVEEMADADMAATLDELVAEGARRMLAAALEAEVDAYVSSCSSELDENGHRLVVRNGHAEARSLVTGAGPLEVRAPRVNDRRVDEATGDKMRFKSSILPPWARKSPKVAEVLPLMYLHGMSSGDFAPALEEFFGSAAGLSASVVTRLTTEWQHERDQFSARSLKDRDYVYVFADGIHFNVRLEEARLCALVIVGVRSDGTKELVSITDGHRESTESWADVLRDLRRRGMTAPVLAVGDGALGFWGALSEVFPETSAPAVLGPQGSQRAERPPQVRSASSAQCPRRDPRRRGPRSCERGDRAVRKGLRGEVAEGRREGRQGPRRPRWRSSTFPPSTGSTSRRPTPSSPRSRRCDCAPR